MKTLRLMRLGPVLSMAGCGTCWLGGRPMPVQCKVGGGGETCQGRWTPALNAHPQVSCRSSTRSDHSIKHQNWTDGLPDMLAT